MITRSEMFESLLAADPSFRPQWLEFLAEWEDEREKPFYIVLGDYARHLIECVADGKAQEFGAIFEAVESWHVEGDLYVREAATTGLLEGIQNLLRWRDKNKSVCRVFASDFEQWLGYETKKHWDDLYRFWDNKNIQD